MREPVLSDSSLLARLKEGLVLGAEIRNWANERDTYYSKEWDRILLGVPIHRNRRALRKARLKLEQEKERLLEEIRIKEAVIETLSRHSKQDA